MKTDLQVKYLQYLNRKKNNSGFTLIELLVVIIIIGILSAIALPAFLNQANKAKQSEAKTNVGSMVRGQQAFYAENGAFVVNASNFSELGLGIATQTANYKYLLVASGDGVGNLGIPIPKTGQAANQIAIKKYEGGAKIGKTQGTGEATTLTVVCEANDPPVVAGAAPGDGVEGLIKMDAATQGAPDCDATTYKRLDK